MVQRVRAAEVRVEGGVVGEMGSGLLALVGVARGDGEAAAQELATRLVRLRVFEDAAGRMNRSLLETGGALGVVSQFTVMADARRGRRPSYAEAAPGEEAEPLVAVVAETARELGVTVVTGEFGAMMDVHLVNAGPVTILLDTERRF